MPVVKKQQTVLLFRSMIILLRGCESVSSSCRIWTVLCSDAGVSGIYYCAPVSVVIGAEVVVGQFHCCWDPRLFAKDRVPTSERWAFCPRSGFVCFTLHCFHCNCMESWCSGCNFSPSSSLVLLHLIQVRVPAQIMVLLFHQINGS